MKQFFTSLICLVFAQNMHAQNLEIYEVTLDSTIVSTNLGFEKNIQLLTPWGWDPNSGNQYPLLVIFDKQNSSNYDYLLHTIDYLASFGQIPAFMILGIEAGEGGKRLIETSFHKENSKGLENDRFLFEELLPMIERDYAYNGSLSLIGHSRYGFYTTYLLGEHAPDLMAVISISPFFLEKGTDLTSHIKEKIYYTHDLDHDLYYAISVGDTIIDTGDFYLMKDTINDMPEYDSFHFLTYEYPDAWHITTPGLTVNQALHDIFHFWQERQMQFYRTDRADVQVHYAELQEELFAHYGTSLDFSLGVLNGTGWRFFGEYKYKEAIQCWKILASAYPTFSEAYYYIALAYSDLGDLKNMERFRQKALQEVQKSTFYTEEERAALLKDLENLKED